METAWSDLLTELWPVLRAGAVTVVTLLIAYVTARLKRALDAQERTAVVEEAVVAAERDPALTSGPEKLAAVEEAVVGTGATRAAIEVAVARLTTSSKLKEECTDAPTDAT